MERIGPDGNCRNITNGAAVSAESVRAAWLAAWIDAEVRARGGKQSQAVVFALFKMYGSAPSEDRLVLDQFLAESVLSGDATVRFDAQAVIREFRIGVALPALRILAARLENMTGPIARDELETVEELVAELGSA
jgi:hypothetical protein